MLLLLEEEDALPLSAKAPCLILILHLVGTVTSHEAGCSSAAEQQQPQFGNVQTTLHGMAPHCPSTTVSVQARQFGGATECVLALMHCRVCWMHVGTIYTIA